MTEAFINDEVYAECVRLMLMEALVAGLRDPSFGVPVTSSTA